MLSFLLLITEENNHDKILYLYNTYHNDMIRLAKNRLRKVGMPNCELDAEDAVQNAFVKIARYIDVIDFSLTEKEIKAYVLSIVVNEVTNIKIDYVYCDDIDECLDTLSDDDFFEKLQIKENYQQIGKKIELMDEKYKIVLLYYYCEDMSVKEIAELLGLSVKTIYTRLGRGRQLLLAEINRMG